MKQVLMGLLLAGLSRCGDSLIVNTGPNRAVLVPREAFNKDQLLRRSKDFIKYAKDVNYRAAKIVFFVNQDNLRRTLGGGKSSEFRYEDWEQLYPIYSARSFPLAETMSIGNLAVMRWRDLDLTLKPPEVLKGSGLDNPLVFSVDNTEPQIVHLDLRETPVEVFRTNLYVTAPHLPPSGEDYAEKLVRLISSRFALDTFVMTLRKDALFIESAGFPIFPDLLPRLDDISYKKYAASPTIICTNDHGQIDCTQHGPAAPAH